MSYSTRERERLYSQALIYASLLEPEYVVERRRPLSGASMPHQWCDIGGGAAPVVSGQPRQFFSEDA